MTSSQTKKDIQALTKKGLPPCNRLKPVEGYSDWYCLRDAPSVDICPDCIESVFERTVFRNSFRRSPPRSLDDKVQCAIGGNPWIRLAWLLTLQQQRSDLNLLKDISAIEESTAPCPGDRAAALSWYGLRDSEGMFLRNFRICYSDVRKIERLLPTLNGLFVRLPHRASYDQHVCGIRPQALHFLHALQAGVSRCHRD